MTTEALKEHISQLREWVTGPRQGMGSGLHAEKWPPLPLGARAMLAEHVMWLEQALAELEAAQQWRPMETALDGEHVFLLMKDGFATSGVVGACRLELPIAWLPLPELPKEGAA